MQLDVIIPTYNHQHLLYRTLRSLLDTTVPARVRPYYCLNPLVGVIDNFRQVAVSGAPPDFRTLGWAGLLALLALAVSYLYFKRLEATMADII